MSIHKNPKNGSWQVRWREFGTHKQKTFRTKSDAKYFQSLLVTQQRPEAVREIESFTGYARTYFEKYVRVEKSETTHADDKYIIENFLIPNLTSKNLHQLSLENLADIKLKMLDDGKSKKRINDMLIVAKRMMNVAVDWGYLKTNPFAKMKLLKLSETSFDFWSIEEATRFFNFCKSYDYSLYEYSAVGFYTGMRLGEILGLQRKAINFRQKQIIIQQQYSQRLKKVLPYTKSKKIRSVPMHPVVETILNPYAMLADDQRVFTRSRNMTHSLRFTAKKAGVKEIRFHDLRHSFASNLVMQGVPIFDVQKLLGHSTIAMTERYSHLAPNYLHESILKLGSTEGKAKQPETNSNFD